MDLDSLVSSQFSSRESWRPLTGEMDPSPADKYTRLWCRSGQTHPTDNQCIAAFTYAIALMPVRRDNTHADPAVKCCSARRFVYVSHGHIFFKGQSFSDIKRTWAA